ncbi:MAG TPA: protein kinase [Chthonomonadales bacterium]|nr:protein kinase [Terriglobia bacterium]HEV2472126.1 protein kinase [Chthonomonadales bacterium]
MTAERWQQVREVLHQALERPPEERSAFLDAACAEDSSLRQEVQSLLESSDEARATLPRSTPAQRPTLRKGTAFDDYEIQTLLGAGGMGEVYRARDLRLGKDVAIKVLPSSFSADGDRLRRFEQEAQAAAALDHPNILTVYRLGTYEGSPYMVSELLEGETLRERLRSGALPVRKALDYAVQVARGLAAAHRKGITHRDLKPENLFLTEGGRVKILDFGLAKLMHSPSEGGTTETARDGTEPGTILGTAGYMSPEQVRGQATDHRSDVFAFGAILYEMLSGKRAFHGATSADTMSAVLNQDPPSLSQAVPSISPGLERVVYRCLEKNADERFQAASDLGFALEALSDAPSASQTAHVANYRTTAAPNEGVRTIWKIGALAAVLAIAALIGGEFYWPSHQSTKLTEKDTIVLADFTDATGDTVFDAALRLGLSVQLEQSPFLSLLSDNRIAQTLVMMSQPKDARLTRDLAREVCQRTGSAATIEGSIASIGSLYVLGLRAVDCHNGDLLAEEQAQATSKEQVLKALGDAATRMRRKLGESLVSIEKYNAPPEEVTTPSFEAWQAYTVGYQEQVVNDDSLAAISSFERAVRLDPKFAMAYARLGTTYSNLDESARAVENSRRGYELSDRGSERERFFIDSHYEQFATGDLEAARKVYELWAQTYPRDRLPPNNLGAIDRILGEYKNALDAIKESLRRDPENGRTYANLVLTFLELNRKDEAKATAQEAQDHHLDSAQIRFSIYDIDFLQRDEAGMQRQVAFFKDKAGQEDVMLYMQSDTAAYAGQFGRARELTRLAADSAWRAGQKEKTAVYRAEAAVREALVGNTGMAKQQAKAAVALSNGLNAEAISALALGLAGDSAEAMRLAKDLDKRSPRDTLVRCEYVPTITAASILGIGHTSKDGRKAVEALAAAAPYELGDPPKTLNVALYPVYLRGQAYLAAHKGAAAAAEFQKILDHPGVVVNEPIGALAHLGLGRGEALEAGVGAGLVPARRLSGAAGGHPQEAPLQSYALGQARIAYQDFLALWKDADPDIPILKQAKAEYAKLK